MSRYINADAFEALGYTSQDGTFDDGVQFVLEKIDEQPTADVVEVKHGEWIYYEEKVPWGDSTTDVTMCKCSVCEYTQDWTSKFCPNCGADMRGKNDDN